MTKLWALNANETDEIENDYDSFQDARHRLNIQLIEADLWGHDCGGTSGSLCGWDW